MSGAPRAWRGAGAGDRGSRGARSTRPSTSSRRCAQAPGRDRAHSPRGARSRARSPTRIKNPLAPIRAAVETLRRLRQRDDPAFDDYFAEATSDGPERGAPDREHRDRVHPVRAPAAAEPHAHRPRRGRARGGHAARRARRRARRPPARGATSARRRRAWSSWRIRSPRSRRDRDQLIQVLTNLVQNGLDAASAIRRDPRVSVTIGPLPNDRVRIVVRDNGPGVAEEMVPRLFEPYATSRRQGDGVRPRDRAADRVRARR